MGEGPCLVITCNNVPKALCGGGFKLNIASFDFIAAISVDVNNRDNWPLLFSEFVII